jgi:hypothetical protein
MLALFLFRIFIFLLHELFFNARRAYEDICGGFFLYFSCGLTSFTSLSVLKTVYGSSKIGLFTFVAFVKLHEFLIFLFYPVLLTNFFSHFLDYMSLIFLPFEAFMKLLDPWRLYRNSVLAALYVTIGELSLSSCNLSLHAINVVDVTAPQHD